MKVGELRGADFARACACLAVFFHHISLATTSSSFPTFLQRASAIAERGKFGVSVFFVLSGFLLSRPFWQACDHDAKFKLQIYVLRRLARIAPATWLCLIVSYLTGRFILHQEQGMELLRLISGMVFLSDWHWVTLFPVDANGPLWSLSFEVSSYLFMPIGFMLLRATFPGLVRGWIGRYLWIAIIVLALIFHGVMTWGFTNPPLDANVYEGPFFLARSWFPRYNPFAFFTMFAIGVFSGGIDTKVSDTSLRRDRIHGFSLLSAGVLLPNFIFYVCASRVGIPMPPLGFPLLPLMTGAFLVASQQYAIFFYLNNRLVSYIARISFGVYIWHDLVIAIMNNVLKNFYTSATEGAIVLTMASLFSTAVIATFSYRYFEEPIMLKARSFEKGRKQVA